VALPAVWCPLPHRSHPDLHLAEAYTAGWLGRWGLSADRDDEADHVTAAGFGRFAAYAYPDSLDLEVAVGWMLWGWLVDDQLDDPTRDAGERAKTARSLSEQLPAEPHPAATSGVAELWRQTAGPMSSSWRERIRGHLRDYVSATLRKPSCAGPASTTVASYCRRRRHHSGVDFSLDLIEAVHGYEVPAAVAGSDLYRAVRGAANDAISWTNDLYSLPREAARGEREHLVAVLTGSYAGSYQQAVKRADAMIREVTEDFLAGCDDLRAARSQFDDVPAERWTDVERSLKDIGGFMAGSLVWHVESARYRSAGPPW
jgi:hypothetical protein